MHFLRYLADRLSFLYRLTTGSGRAMPDFLVIGVQKGGTRFLNHCLSQHPELALAFKKEVHFFDSNYDKGLNWYKAYFPFKTSVKGKTVGEITPRYIVMNNVPARCVSTLPDAKIIVLLRDPIDRTYSHYQMTKRIHGINLSFEEYIEQTINVGTMDLVKKGKLRAKKLNSLKRGQYKDQIKRWFEHYPRENFLFIESESLFQNPKDALEKIYQFLGVSSIIPNDLTPQNNGHYSKEINEETKSLLKDYFQESNDWLKKEGFNLKWLKQY